MRFIKNFPEKGIYFLFNPVNWKKKPWQDNIREILPYISAMQMRSPELNDTDFYSAAKVLKEILTPCNIPLLINNRLDIAITLNADGIHIGKEDMPIPQVRKLFKGIIGASRHTPDSAELAQKEGADYIGCGPVFKTQTKILKREIIGTEGYLKVKRAVEIPVIPIGGINFNNISKLKGFTEIIAVSSAINLSEDPVLTAREIMKAVSCKL